MNKSPKSTNLLTFGNPKVLKGQGQGYLTAILHLAPSRMSGFNTCPMSTVGCSSACLNTAGRGGMFAGEKTANMTGAEMVTAIKTGKIHNVIQNARIRKTTAFFNDRANFMNQLVKEIRKVVKSSQKHNMTPAIRLNGTSDLRWEVYPVMVDGVKYDNIMAVFPNIQFYDYTKIPNRKNIPSNYQLTFSLAESNMDNAITALVQGMNVAAVFRTKNYPKRFLGRRVVDGDKTDLRFLDPKGVIVGLSAKGKAKKDVSGFVYETLPLEKKRNAKKD